MVEAETKIIGAQKGPQTDFLSSPADIVIFGGAAYGGKSFGLLLESTRYIGNPRFNGVIFRRESPQITSGGGLWDTAGQIYPYLDGVSKEQQLKYIFPSGAYLKFSHLQYEKDKLNHQGAQYVFIGFDELTHFTETQFWYVLTRNRPPAGCDIRPYCRCTTNPESDSWVRELISWWIDQDTGYAIPERSGIVRYFTRIDENIIWVDKNWIGENGIRPRSITFIPSYLQDNPLGIEADPNYESNLQAQDRVTRERLLKGNWNVTYKGGMFNPSWFKKIKELPKGVKWVRYWDRAATEPKDENDDPDWTVGAKCAMYGGELYIADIVRFRGTPAENEIKIKECAVDDGYDVAIGYEVEPGSSGVEVASYYQTKVLQGYEVHLDRPKGSKVERCKPWCALAENGHVYVYDGDWNRNFFGEAGSFPLEKKDQIDAVSGCYKMLTRDKYVFLSIKLSDTVKLNLNWQKTNTRNSIHYGAITLLDDMSVWILEALWDDIAGKLHIYGCWASEDSTPALIVPQIIRRMKMKQFVVNRLLCSDTMFQADRSKKSTGYFYRQEFKKRKVTPSLGQPLKYDQPGSILSATQMFHMNQIYVDHSAKDAVRQFSSWTIEKGKPSKEDCGYCICLCMIISELKRKKLLAKVRQIPDYHKKDGAKMG